MKFSDYDLYLLTGLSLTTVETLRRHSKAKSRFEILAFLAFKVALIPFLIGILLLIDELIVLQQSLLLKNIFTEVAKFNEVVDNLEILEKLRNAGNKIDITDRNKVIKALELMKEDLKRALKTERILRENPQFKPESFSVDLTTLRALQVSEQGSEYGKVFADAMKVAIGVQETMRDLTSS
jgi:hypothetical protein